MIPETLSQRLRDAIALRREFWDAAPMAACRLFNGFYEGLPSLALDLYAKTVVIHNYAKDPEEIANFYPLIQSCVLESLPWVRAICIKSRYSRAVHPRHDALLYGDVLDKKIQEHGVWYALNLSLHRETSFYLDTRNLRRWLLQNTQGKTVLNTFAYTGSLGVAALAGGAQRVVQLDTNRTYLDLARESCGLNKLPLSKMDLIAEDFWVGISVLKKSRRLFDCVVLDPPFFAAARTGEIDLSRRPQALINKVRPLIRDGGILAVVNNALFLSGADFMNAINDLCRGGYLCVETTIPIAADFTGYPETITQAPPIDPAPFNHPTKIVMLRVKRKSA